MFNSLERISVNFEQKYKINLKNVVCNMADILPRSQCDLVEAEWHIIESENYPIIGSDMNSLSYVRCQAII